MGLCVVAQCIHDARHRYACEDCRETIRKHLREIEYYHQIIQATKAPARRGDTGRRAPGYGSRSPARDDAVVADDYRSRSTGDGKDDQDGAVRSLLGTLHGIAQWVRGQRDVSEPRTPLDVNREIGWLLPQIDWCSAQPWVGELAADVNELHHEARFLAFDSPAKAIGTCLTTDCDGKVYPARLLDPYAPSLQPREGGRCARCDWRYDWLELIKIRRLTG